MLGSFAKIIKKCVQIVSNQDKIKKSLSVKIVVALNFMWSIIKNLHLKYCPVCNDQMEGLSKIKSHSDAVDYFKELPFYNKPIEKAKVKRLKTIDRSAELIFYEQLIVINTNQSFTGYAMSNKVEIIERKSKSNCTIRSK